MRCIVEHPALPGGRWTGTRELNVQFKPTIVKVFKKNYNTLECHVKSNPPATITWMLKTGRSYYGYPDSKIIGKTLNLKENNLKSNDSVECIAENIHGRDLHTVKIKNVHSSYGKIAAWKFSVAAAIIIFLIALVYLWISKKRKLHKKHQSRDEPLSSRTMTSRREEAPLFSPVMASHVRKEHYQESGILSPGIREYTLDDVPRMRKEDTWSPRMSEDGENDTTTSTNRQQNNLLGTDL